MAAERADALAGRYARIEAQLGELFEKAADPVARMATAAALLHHKMPHFFWTGFYFLRGGDLIVGPYQGPLACAVLRPRGSGVCWACAERGAPVVVPDVHAFAGHIACDSRAESEVVVPVRDRDGNLAAVLDVDGERKNAFGGADVDGLVRIAARIYGD
ncbi:MAG: GAF domain-containing protein [Proteobacteria bacterium]|jgi:GAF domain-containing protein|nr:GAF domain-containing protein [Pseudomonadota bacterium]